MVFFAADYSSLVRLSAATVVDRQVAQLAVYVAPRHSHSMAARLRPSAAELLAPAAVDRQEALPAVVSLHPVF